jgi:hypothetical protein
MGIAFLCRGISAGGSCSFMMDYLTLIAGSQAMAGISATPAMYLDAYGQVHIGSATGSGRTIVVKTDASGGVFHFGNTHYQGGTAPMVVISGPPTVEGGSGSQILELGNTDAIGLDTSPHPCVAYLPGGFSGTPSVNLRTRCDTSSGLSQFTGQRPAAVTGVSGTNRNSSSIISGASYDGPLSSEFGPSDNLGLFTNGQVIAGTSYNILVNGGTPSAPTAVISAGGGVPVGTHTYQIGTVWQNNAIGSVSSPSQNVVVTPGNQTVTLTWTGVAGSPKAYSVSRDNSLIGTNGGGFCPQTTTTTSYVDTGSVNCGASTPNIPAGGPSMLMAGAQGIAAPALILSGSGSLTGPPGLTGIIPAAGYQNSAYDPFNRSNGGLGSNWTNALVTGGTFNISGNQVVGVAGNGFFDAYWNANTFNQKNNMFAQTTIITSSAGGTPGIGAALVQADGQSYACMETTTALQLNRIAAQFSIANIATTAITFAAGDVVRLEFTTAGAMTCKSTNGGGISITGTDVTITGPFFPGLAGGNPAATAGTVDNWSGGNLHPIAQLDTEQDWTQPQHFISPVTIGPTNPVAGALTANALYVNPIISQTANPASSGTLRLASTEAIEWRNNANNNDVGLTKNVSDVLLYNGTQVTLTIASGTATMTTAAIAGGACGTTVTVGAANVLTTDAITWSFNASVGINPGELNVTQWPTAGNVNFQYCNETGASVTPTAATLNWRVVR